MSNVQLAPFYPRYCRWLRLPAKVWVRARARAVCERQPRVCRRHGSSAIQARITKFGPEMQNTLVKILIVLGAINLDLQCRIQLKSSNWPLFDLVHTITHHVFMPGSLNLDLRCKTPWYKISIVLCHRLNPLHVYLSRQSRVLRRLTSPLSIYDGAIPWGQWEKAWYNVFLISSDFLSHS